MKFFNTGFCSGALGVFFIFVLTAPIVAQNSANNDLISRIEKTSKERRSLLIGFGYTSTSIRIRDGIEESRNVSRVEKLRKNVWRATYDNKDGEGKAIIAKNDDFDYTAGGSGEDFEYGSASYDSEKPRPAPYFDGVFGMRLRDFIKQPSVEFQIQQDLPAQGNLRVQGITFVWNDSGMEIKGVLHWLPDHNYVITKCRAVTELPGEEEYVMGDTEIEYEIFEGRLVPARKTIHGKKSTLVEEYSDFATANQNETFYKAEAVGLETPTRPRNSKWYWWIGAAAVCVSIASWVHFRKKRKLN